MEREPDSSSLEGTLNPPELKGFLGQNSLIPVGKLLHFVVINSMVLEINRPNITSCRSGIHPEERTPHLWDEEHLMLHCSVMKEKTLNQPRDG